MQSVSAAFNNAIHSPGRVFSYAFRVNGQTTVSPASVLDVEINEEACDGTNISVGTFNKTELTMTVLKDTAVGATWRGSYVDISVSITGASDSVSLGRFWIYVMEDIGAGRWRLTGYDLPQFFGEEYDLSDTSVSTILSSLEAGSGMTISGKENLTLSEITSVPDGVTNQQMLGYLAGYDEFSVRADRHGGLELFRFGAPAGMWLTPSAALTPSSSLVPGHLSDAEADVSTGRFVRRKDIYITGFTCEPTVTVTGLRYSNGEEQFETGSGYGIEYMNPYMTADHFATLGAYIGLGFSPMTVPWRGNPAHQAGDSVNVETAPGVYSTCLIMRQRIRIDGGYTTTYYCYSDDDMKKVIGSSPTMNKIMEAYRGMQALLSEAIDQILGRGNGYASYVYDENGTWVGLQITDSPTITPQTRGWRWVYGGLYYSEDGFQTIHKTALTADGYILGDVIAAHSILTESLSVEAQRAVDGAIENFSFEEDGLHIAAKDGDTIVSTYQALFNDMGFRVMLTETNQVTLLAEGDSVEANNLTANTYLRVKADNVASRWQQFYSSVYGEYNFGVFWEVN